MFDTASLRGNVAERDDLSALGGGLRGARLIAVAATGLGKSFLN